MCTREPNCGLLIRRCLVERNMGESTTITAAAAAAAAATTPQVLELGA